MTIQLIHKKSYVQLASWTFLIFFLVLFFLKTDLNNTSSLENFKENNDYSIEDEIKPYCNGINYEKASTMQLNKIENIDIYFVDKVDWFKNILEALNNQNKSNSIEKKFKKNFEANIKISFLNNLSCTFKSRIRISGDWKDHLDSSSLMSSMDIKLTDGNIEGITSFKLFLPRTRNFENEIIGTSILGELNILAPRTRYVNVNIETFGNKSFIFQEKIKKEFLEFNNISESAIIESDERFIWDNRINNDVVTEQLLDSYFTRIINSTWANSSPARKSVSVTSLNSLNHAFINKISNTVIDYRNIKNIENIEALIQYDTVMMSLGAFHGLGVHQRKFYYNFYEDRFYPIYYDGNFNFFSILEERDLDVFIKENFFRVSPSVSSILSNVRSINKDKLTKTIIKKGVENFTTQELDIILGNFVRNLKFIETFNSSDKLNLNNALSEINPENFIDVNSVGVYLSSRNDILIGCTKNTDSSKKVVCGDINIDNDLNIFDDESRLDNKLIIPLGFYEDKVIDSAAKEIIITDSISLKTWGSVQVNFDDNQKTINISGDSNSKVLIIGDHGSLNQFEWSINSSFSNNKNKINLNLPFNGCLNFYNIYFKNNNFKNSGGMCEDSINIVNSEGLIETIEILNSHSDGLDIDFSNIDILNLDVLNSGNDCLDISKGIYTIKNVVAKNCGDKGISIGENSKLNNSNSIIENANIAIAVKDSSNANIEKLEVSESNLCFSLYRKKQEFGSSYLYIGEKDCESKQYYIQEGSTLIINNND